MSIRRKSRALPQPVDMGQEAEKRRELGPKLRVGAWVRQAAAQRQLQSQALERPRPQAPGVTSSRVGPHPAHLGLEAVAMK